MKAPSYQELIDYAVSTIPKLISYGIDTKPFITKLMAIASKGKDFKATLADFDELKAMEKPLRDELNEPEPPEE